MYRVSFILIFGLVYNISATAELKLDGVSPAELKEIQKEIANGNVPPNYAATEKLRRGAAKLTNTDSPSFNYLSNPTTTKTTTVPVRYVYNNQQPYQLYQSQSPYLPLVQQNAHAAQIASQYYNPSVTHFLQTPTQIQYVSTPGVGGQIPSAKFQALNSKTPTSTATTTQQQQQQQYYTPQYIPQFYQPQYYIPTQTAAAASATGGQATTPGAATGVSASAPAHAGMRMYPSQPVVMLLFNPSPYMYVPQHHAAAGHQHYSYLLGQHPLLNYYGQQRYTYPYAQPQVTYLVPMGVPGAGQQGAASGAAATAAGDATGPSLDSAPIIDQQESKVSTNPDISHSNTFGIRTKSS